MDLALGMVEAPGARPAVRPGVDRLVALVATHARQRICREVQRVVPVDRDEWLSAAAVEPSTGAVLQIAKPHRGFEDPDLGTAGSGERIGDLRGIRVCL
jgi:hypothetical protein